MFQFKQFSVKQNQCAMKVGTDGVLLGAWAKLPPQTQTILDIGAGTGVIALMLAQRSSATLIDAVEIDKNAYEQCVDNFENSQWNDVLFCYHASFSTFVSDIEEQYDVIVSNPPFYTENYKTAQVKRNQTRFSDALPFEELVKGVGKLLSNNGLFSIIIPYKEELKIIDLAQKEQLYPAVITRVRGNEKTIIKRSLIAFSKTKQVCKENELTLEINRGEYTEVYKKMVAPFYLRE